MSDVKTGKVSIRPYISGAPNAGLEKYDLVIAEGAQHKEYLAFVEQNGVKRYLTGLNELAPEVQRITDKEKKEAVILDIRKTVVFLENSIAANYELTEKDIHEYEMVDEMKEVDEVNDKGEKTGETIFKPTGKKKEVVKGFSDKFWGKVTMFISQGPDKFDNQKQRERIPTYWDSVEVKCGNKPTELDPKNPHDLIMIYAIRAGAFESVAPSLEAARTSMNSPKFYLDNEIETAGIKTELKKLRNKAGSLLQKLYEKDTIKLFYVTKLAAANSLSYRKNTSIDIMYNDCDMYINGETVEKNKKLTAQKFIDFAEGDLKDLRVQAIVRDSTEMQLMTYKTDGQLYYNKTGTPMGKGLMDVVTFLANPMNKEILDSISEQVEAEWVK